MDNNCLSNVLVELRVTINVMTYETMNKIRCTKVKLTNTVLQLADRYTIAPYGIVEDILVVVDSWEYPMDFMVVKIKSNMVGYPMLLGRPWLATTDAYIECRIGKMPISNGESTKNIVTLLS